MSKRNYTGKLKREHQWIWLFKKSKTGVMGGCKLTQGCWELNSSTASVKKGPCLADHLLTFLISALQRGKIMETTVPPITLFFFMILIPKI